MLGVMASPDKTPLLDEAREYLRQVPQDQHGPLNHGDAILAAAVARVRELTEALTEAGLALAEASVDLDQAGKQVAASDAHQAQKSIVAVLNSEEPKAIGRPDMPEGRGFGVFDSEEQK